MVTTFYFAGDPEHMSKQFECLFPRGHICMARSEWHILTVRYSTETGFIHAWTAVDECWYCESYAIVFKPVASGILKRKANCKYINLKTPHTIQLGYIMSA